MHMKTPHFILNTLELTRDILLSNIIYIMLLKMLISNVQVPNILCRHGTWHMFVPIVSALIPQRRKILFSDWLAGCPFVLYNETPMK